MQGFPSCRELENVQNLVGLGLITFKPKKLRVEVRKTKNALLEPLKMRKFR
jgi:hypothetical protein